MAVILARNGASPSTGISLKAMSLLINSRFALTQKGHH
jgi:hypothetical protein